MFETKKYHKNSDGDEVERLQDWLWPKDDVGLYKGPKEDWCKEHSHKWLKYCQNKRVAIQAGGGAGMYPQMLALHFGLVYTFEPYPLSFHCLVNNCQEINIVKIQAALGDQVCMIDVNINNPKNLGENNVVLRDKPGIPQLTIDTFNFLNVDLIALDVEGYESKILLGAQSTINKWHPVIVCENGSDLRRHIAKFGYKAIDQSVSDTIFAVP